MNTEDGSARIILISLFNKKIALILNLLIFDKSGSHFVCFYGNDGLAEKLYLFLLSKTHSAV